jgi:hypothetical protein
VESKLLSILGSQERPAVVDVLRKLESYCRSRSLRMPSRATIYNAMDRVPIPMFAYEDLPSSVQRTLHNVAHGPIPGHQIAFAAFSYGDSRALSFAAGLPWVCLRAASKARGFRPKSRALLDAVIAYRGI